MAVVSQKLLPLAARNGLMRCRMNLKSTGLLTLFLGMAVLASACNMPANQPPNQVGPNIVFTAAAQTVEAQLTQNALLIVATPVPATPLPSATNAADTETTSTPTPASVAETITTPGSDSTPCDAARFVADVSIPDGTLFGFGATFTKTWRLKNIGSCTWDASYSLVFDAGDAMGGPARLPLPGRVAPGQEVDLSVSLIAPAKAGKYRGYWRLQNTAGQTLPIEKGYNGKSFFVEIEVKPGNSESGPVKFAVTSVTFNTERSGSCAAGKYTVTATITVNKGGLVTYTWIRSDGATGPANSGSLEFDKAGNQSITFEWTTGASGLWVDLYIDEPNHQQFGRAMLNCP
jgi:hypothetical protein